MTRHGPVLAQSHLEIYLDDLILTNVLAPREAADLSPDELDVLRSNIRSEIFYSERVRDLLIARAKEVLQELRREPSE